jgi:PAS domain S-box-containing protein
MNGSADPETPLRQIAENLREFIWLSNAEFTTHYYVNPAYERIWGRSRASLYADARSLLEGVHPEDREHVSRALLEMPLGEYNIEYRVVRPDGEVRWVWSRGFPVRDDEGRAHRIAGITEDITARKQAEEERERVAESRTRLIRGFTHDVKNPLGAADGFLALLLDGVHGELAAPQTASVERARRSIRSALDLIAQVLEVARAEAGELDIRARSVDVNALVSQAAEDWRAQAQANGLSLSLELAPDLPTIESDPARVAQVIANLVSNAIKYTPRGGRITLRAQAPVAPVARVARTDGEWIVIEVADTGKGIAAAQQAMLFREFTRFEPQAAHGAGIGLAISQHVAHALGGEIRVRSAPDLGSTFSLWLPMRGAGGVSPPPPTPTRSPHASPAVRAGDDSTASPAADAAT